MVVVINLFIFFFITLILFFVRSILVIIFHHFPIHKIKRLKLLLLLLQLQFILILHSSYIPSLLVSMLFLVIFKEGNELRFKNTIKRRGFFLLQLPISLLENSLHVFYPKYTDAKREIAFTGVVDLFS